MSLPDDMDAYFVTVAGCGESNLSSDDRPFYITDAQKAALLRCTSPRNDDLNEMDRDETDFISRPTSGILVTRRRRNMSEDISNYPLDIQKGRHRQHSDTKISTDTTDSSNHYARSDSESTLHVDEGVRLYWSESDAQGCESPEHTIVQHNGSNEKCYSEPTKSAARQGCAKSRHEKRTMDTGRRKQLRFNDIQIAHGIEAKMSTYLKYLEAHFETGNFLKEELHTNARDNQTDKINVLCGFLCEKKYNLCENNLLGDRYKETALAVAIVKGSTECAKVLIDIGGPEIVCKTYTTKQYAGVMPLHLAIIKQHAGLVEYMLNMLDESTKRNVINSKAHGKYFKDKYACPWVPLALAIGIGHINIFGILLRHGANLLVKDPETGDTILHNLARVAKKVPSKAKQTLHRLLHSTEVKVWWRENMPKAKASNMIETLLKTKNTAGYTPMSYAVCLGAAEFAEAILNLDQVYTFPQWHVGPEQATVYEVSEIDPAVAPKDCEVPSVLEMYTFSISDNALSFGNIPHIRQTMEKKWRAYRSWFITWFVYHSLVMLSFTIYCTQFHVLPVFIAIPEHVNTSFNTSRNIENHTIAHSFIFDGSKMLTWKDYAIQSLELFVLLSALFYFFIEVCDTCSLISKLFRQNRHHVHAKRHSVRWLSAQFDLLRIMLFMFSVSVPILFVLRLIQSEWQDVFYATAAVTGWTFMLFFIRALKKIGIFTAMMSRMIMGELSHFLLLFTIGLVGCGTGLYTLFILTPKENPTEVSNIGQTFFTLFKVIVGLDEFQILEEVRSAWIAKFVFTFFVFFCHILLLNMLIAAMNNTYNRLSGAKEVLWLQLRTKAVLLIERRLAKCLRPHHGLEQLQAENEELWCLCCEGAEKDHPLTNFGFDEDVLSIK